MDQGLSKVIKSRYRKKLLQHIMTMADNYNTHLVVSSAWEEILSETIMNCFHWSPGQTIAEDSIEENVICQMS